MNEKEIDSIIKRYVETFRTKNTRILDCFISKMVKANSLELDIEMVEEVIKEVSSSSTKLSTLLFVMLVSLVLNNFMEKFLQSSYYFSDYNVPNINSDSNQYDYTIYYKGKEFKLIIYDDNYTSVNDKINNTVIGFTSPYKNKIVWFRTTLHKWVNNPKEILKKLLAKIND